MPKLQCIDSSRRMYWYCSRGAGHLVLPAHRQDLHEADVEEQPFHDAAEDDQALQQLPGRSPGVPVLNVGSVSTLMNGIRKSSLSRIDLIS